MKEKLLAFASKVYSASPFATGLVLGYFGKPIISFLINLVF